MKHVLWVLFIWLGSANSYAQEYWGGDISYEQIQADTFIVRLRLFQECDTFPLKDSLEIHVSADSNCGFFVKEWLFLEPGYPKEATPVCDTSYTNCTDTVNGYPGIQQLLYSSKVFIGNVCDTLSFTFTGCCRTGAIQTGPFGPLFLYATLYNNTQTNPTTPIQNSSPQFSNEFGIYGCDEELMSYNPIGIDPNGDTLFYSAAPCMMDSVTIAPFSLPFTYQQPITTMNQDSFIVGELSGSVIFRPNTGAVSVICLEIRQLRDGKIIGVSNHEMVILVGGCSNQLPYSLGMDGRFQDFDTATCPGGDLTFNFKTFDPDPGQKLTVKATTNAPGAVVTFDTTGNHPVGTFTW